MVTIKNVLLRTNPIEESVLYIKIFKIGFYQFNCIYLLFLAEFSVMLTVLALLKTECI